MAVNHSQDFETKGRARRSLIELLSEENLMEEKRRKAPINWVVEEEEKANFKAHSAVLR